IAVVGLSADWFRPSYFAAKYMQEHGYRIIPVNPHLRESLGEKAYPDLASVPEPIDLVLIFQRSEKVPPFVEQAIAVGAKAVWLQLGIAHAGAAAQAEAAGLDVVQDACMLVEHRRWRAA
ncbi:MAG: CoA-binding protein, partial [Anaerolineales bacterium]|nr:CoA-binding protein [Anaerolineales bacterium]